MASYAVVGPVSSSAAAAALRRSCPSVSSLLRTADPVRTDRLTTRANTASSFATTQTRSLSVLSSANGSGVRHMKSLQFQQRRFQPQQKQQQQVRTVFIQTADTPNPESLKFVPTGHPVLVQEEGDESLNGYYVTKTDAVKEILRSPLAKSLLDIDGVKAVYLGADFVTVTKYAEHKWKLLRPQIFEVLMEWTDSGKPALLDAPEITDTTILEDDDEVVAMIKELIEARIRPAVQEDGGDIRYVGFDEETGIVTVELAGSCVGCPSSSVTLKQGVENMLMHYIPEVTAVVALEEEEEHEEDGGGAEDGENASDGSKKQKSYEERLAAAGIPFSE